jgi:hypothetical protein
VVCCTNKAILPGLEGGQDASEDFSIPLVPDFPGSYREDLHEVFQMTVPFSFYDGLKEI